ncbi:MAG: ornithine aminotransferase [Bacteroidetes bacterium RIFCSPLOWO2_12_FULL_35_15]|nr:MAG: ornithine aminotransferase [Bacteroidetes bacterium RIFCSPLOWO2_12_FULL_35_15]
MKSDSEIQKNVMEELNWEPLLNASEIGVAVKNGVVTLSGTVNTYSKKLAAEEAAKRVLGVKAVAEDLEVLLAVHGKKTDADIAQAVINALKWHTSIPDEKIKVKVENGWVTLDGEVEWEFQRNSARTAVKNLAGVVGISNNIAIVPTLKISDVKNKITSAFQRSATIDAEKITISSEGSKVILTGKVRSYVEKRDAEKAAWLAPGVNKVENKLEIDAEVYAF